MVILKAPLPEELAFSLPLRQPDILLYIPSCLSFETPQLASFEPNITAKGIEFSDAGFVIHFFIFEIDAAGRTAGSTGAAGNATIFVKAYPVDTVAGEKPEQRTRRTDVGAEITPLKPHQNGKQCQQSNRKPGA